MRARLVIIDPADANEPPPAPTLLVEDGAIGIYSAGHWSRPIPREHLEEVTESDIRTALRLSPGSRPMVFLSEVRELPTDDLLDSKFLLWTREWWASAVADLLVLTAVA